MADKQDSSWAEGADSNVEEETFHSEEKASNSYGRRFGTAAALLVLSLLLIVLSAWLYPQRGVVVRPAPFALTMISGIGHLTGFSVTPLTVVPSPGYSDPSEVSLIVAPAGRDLYKVHLEWTYAPALCSDGVARSQAEGTGCSPTSPPYALAGSQVKVSLPAGATIVRCSVCEPGYKDLLLERDNTVRPAPYLPDASVNTKKPAALPLTASWDFEIHDTAFAWTANGLNAEGNLPIVTFQNDGNVGYGNVSVKYQIPGGSNYDWNSGPSPDGLTWTEPVSSAASAVQVTGTDNNAAATDTRNILIVGILLGAAGGALVGAIQEIAHVESEGARNGRRRKH